MAYKKISSFSLSSFWLYQNFKKRTFAHTKRIISVTYVLKIDFVCFVLIFQYLIFFLAHQKVVTAAIDTITVGTRISISTVVTVAAVTRNDPEMIVVMVIEVRRSHGIAISKGDLIPSIL